MQQRETWQGHQSQPLFRSSFETEEQTVRPGQSGTIEEAHGDCGARIRMCEAPDGIQALDHGWVGEGPGAVVLCMFSGEPEPTVHAMDK